MTDILLKKAIEKFDIINFLEENNIDYSLHHKNVGKNWVGVYECPFCKISNYHYAINLENKTCNCWNCNEGKTNLIKFISLILKISYKNAKEFIIEETLFGDCEEDLEDRINNIFEEKPLQAKPKNVKILNLPRNVKITKHLLLTKPFIQAFLFERGLRHEQIQKYDLRIGLEGQAQYKLIIPIYFKNQLTAYQLRNLNQKIYINIGDIKQYLYDYDNIPKHCRLIMVEGFFDFTSTNNFIQKHRKNIFHVTTPFSKKITPTQIELIQDLEPSEIIYFLDRDAFFEYHETEQSFNCPIRFIVPPVDRDDPGKMRERDFLKLFEESNL